VASSTSRPSVSSLATRPSSPGKGWERTGACSTSASVPIVHPDDVERLWLDIDLSAEPRKAERFEALGREMNPGDNGRTTFLCLAAEHRQLDGRHEEALALIELATAPDEVLDEEFVHPSVIALRSLLALGRTQEADAVLADRLAAFRRDEVDSGQCLRIGDALEFEGDLVRAHRWFTLPLAPYDPQLDIDMIDELVLEARYRLRRRRELGYDAYDELYEELTAGDLID
jgi:hypothetical protein